jgi:hypothetical protein
MTAENTVVFLEETFDGIEDTYLRLRNQRHNRGCTFVKLSLARWMRIEGLG